MKSLKNLRLTDKKGKLNLDSYLNVYKITVKAKYKESTLMNLILLSLSYFYKGTMTVRDIFLKGWKDKNPFFAGLRLTH